MGVARIPVGGGGSGRSLAESLFLNNNIRIYNFSAPPAKETNTFVGLTETLDGPAFIVNTPSVLQAAPKFVRYRIEQRPDDVIYQKWDGGEETGSPLLLACNWWAAANDPTQFPNDTAYIAMGYSSPGNVTAPTPTTNTQCYAQIRQYLRDKTHFALVTSVGDGTPDNVVNFLAADYQGVNPGCGHRVALLIDPITAGVYAYVDGEMRASLVGAKSYPKHDFFFAVNATYAHLELTASGLIGAGTTINFSATGFTVVNIDTHLATTNVP